MDEVPLFPAFLKLRGMRVLVVGGGPVGQRKAKLATDAGAIAVVIDPALPGGCPFKESHLDGIQLAFACATAEVNERVIAACKRLGVLACDAIVPERGTFLLPSVLKRGELQIAISTGGASPALARRIREELETTFDESYGDWVGLLGAIRKEVLNRVPDIALRKKIFEEFAREDWLHRFRSEGRTAVMEAMRLVVKTHSADR